MRYITKRQTGGREVWGALRVKIALPKVRNSKLPVEIEVSRWFESGWKIGRDLRGV